MLVEDKKLLVEYNSMVLLIISNKELSNWIVYIVDACVRIRRILIDHIALADYREILHSLLQGLNVGGLFHYLCVADVSTRSMYTWLAFN